MSASKCFVIMGFGIKTDFATGRKLDLNKSYNALIKPVVKSKGLTCVRADEIHHSGVIDVIMYQELLEADVVIADLSTANPNAFYELGIRHALRPFTTIVISENKLPYPFDLNHVTIKSYTHLCDVIDYDEVLRFQGVLSETLDAVLQSPKTDSPVYTYLDGLLPPSLQKRAAEIAVEIGEAMEQNKPAKKKKEENKTISLLTEQGEQAVNKRKYNSAKAFFGSVLEILESGAEESRAINPYIYQRLAFCIYKSREPFRLPKTRSKDANHLLALKEAMDFLGHLDLNHTNDPETLSLAGAIEKKLFEQGEGIDHLSAAMLYFLRTFYLLYSRYNGISLAYLWACQANSPLSSNTQEKIADLVNARRMWKMVLAKCDKDMNELLDREKRNGQLPTDTGKYSEDQRKCDIETKFWILCNKAEAYYGLGEIEQYKTAWNEALEVPHEGWMRESYDNQFNQLKEHLQAVGYLVSDVWEKQPNEAVT